jgi:hypothetical protein
MDPSFASSASAADIYSIFRRVCKIAKSDCYIRNISVSVCLSVCLSVRMEQLGSHWRDFRYVLVCACFANLSSDASLMKI